MNLKKYNTIDYEGPTFKGKDILDFKLPVYECGDSGTRILFVFDRIARNEAETQTILCPEKTANRYGTSSPPPSVCFQNVFKYAQEQAQDSVRFAYAINFQAFKVGGLKGRPKQEAEQAFWERIERYIERVKPNRLVFFGAEAKEFFKTKYNLSFWPAGRVETRDGISACWTLNYIDWAGISDSSFANLAGLVSRHIRDVIDGKNRYSISQKPHKNINVNTISKFDKLLAKMYQADICSLDTETKNLYKLANKMLSIQVTMDGQNAYFIPLFHKETPFDSKELEYIIDKLREFFETNTNKYHIYHSAKFDLAQLEVQMGVRYYNAPVADSGSFLYNLDQNLKYMSNLGQTYLGKGIKSAWSLKWLEEHYGYERKNIAIEKDDRANMADKPLHDIFEYSTVDVITPYRIVEQELKEAEDRGPRYSKYFINTIDALGAMSSVMASMEVKGLRIDRDYLIGLQSNQGQFKQRIAEIEKEFYNFESVKQANANLLRKKGAPSKGLFGEMVGNNWVWMPNKEESRQELVFNVLQLEPLKQRASGGGAIDKKFYAQYEGTPEVDLMKELAGINKAYGTFVNGFLKRLVEDEDAQLDGCIRSYFNFLNIITGRSSSCLTGNTKIRVLDPRGCIPIKKVKSGDWVWAYNKKLKPVPAQVEWAGYTKTTEDLVEVSYLSQGNRKIKRIICTPDHRFRLRDGSYIRADKLKKNDRLLSLEVKQGPLGDTDYRYVYYTGKKEKISEHRLVMNTLRGKVTHHIDLSRNNNLPSNLLKCTQIEHNEIHKNTLETHEKRSLSQKEFRASVEGKALSKKHSERMKLKRGSDCPDYYTLDPLWVLNELKEAGGRPTYVCKKYNMDFNTFKQKITDLDLWPQVREIIFRCGKYGYITDKQLKKAAKLTNYDEAGKSLGIGNRKAKVLLRNDNNHTVRYVKRLKSKPRKVYDLTIPKYHNFIANGICVHNSSPNLQQIPSRDAVAKIIKRQFIAHAGYANIKADYNANEVRGWCNVSNDINLAKSFIRALRAARDFRVAPNNANFEELNKQIEALDIHVQSVLLFYGKKVNKKHPLRQAIKFTVFGVIYGMSANGLFNQLSETMDDITIEKAQELIKLLFEKFPQGGEWIKQQHRDGRKNYELIGPLGGPRHLYGYLNHQRSIQSALDRQGCNSVIQGPCSQIAYRAARSLKKLVWDVSNGIDVDLMQSIFVNNMIHDCILGDSLIPTNRGLMRIDEMATLDAPGKKSIDLEVASRYKKEKACKWIYKGVKDTVVIKTELGNEIIGTPNHELLVFDGLNHVWKKIEQLNKGDLLCVSLKGDVTRKTKLPLDLTVFHERISTTRFGMPDPRMFMVKRPTAMTKDLAFILGLILKEGTRNKKVVHVYNTDEKLLDRYEKCVYNVFGLKPSRYINKKAGIKGNFNFEGRKYITETTKICHSSEFCSKQILTWFDEIGLPSATARNKKIPWSILQSSVKIQLVFLVAFLEGDGGVTDKGEILFRSSSKTMLSQIQKMLLAMGFLAKLSNTAVYLGPEHARRFGEFVRSKLGKSINKYSISRPLPKVVMNHKKEEYAYTKIISKKKGKKEKVYDLTISNGEPAYIANGLVVHNSTESNVLLQLMPLGCYLMEHAMTTVQHKELSEVYDWNLQAGLEIEFEIGPNLGDMKKWNGRFDDLEPMFSICLADQIGRGDVKKSQASEIKDKFHHNLKNIKAVRTEELLLDIKKNSNVGKPSKRMFLSKVIEGGIQV